MTLAGRLERIETRLTPKQAVLYWLKEAQEDYENFDDYLAELATQPSSAAPWIKIPHNVAKAVRDSLRYRKCDDEIARIALRAKRRTHFLVVVPFRLNGELSVNATQDWLSVQLLQEQRVRMAEQYREHGGFDREEWEWWQKTLLALLRRLWRLKATIEAVSLRYYHGSGILFGGQERDLNECIARAECLAQVYNVNTRQGITLPAVNLAAHRRSAEREVPDAVCKLVSEVRAICR
jgi:hypothetical protein